MTEWNQMNKAAETIYGAAFNAKVWDMQADCASLMNNGSQPSHQVAEIAVKRNMTPAELASEFTEAEGFRPFVNANRAR